MLVIHKENKMEVEQFNGRTTKKFLDFVKNYIFPYEEKEGLYLYSTQGIVQLEKGQWVGVRKDQRFCEVWNEEDLFEQYMEAK
jgi:hypothetical protein